MKSIGQIAYEAYCVSVHISSYVASKGVSEAPLPKWGDQDDKVQAAWQAAAMAVALSLFHGPEGG